MSAKSFSLSYDGYWREPNIDGIPTQTGVYSVYACRYNSAEKTVTLRKLIYIGEAQNARKRIHGHEKWRDWRRHLNAGEELCFNFAQVTADRQRAEAALINHHKPPENTEYVNEFPFDQTTVSTSGRNALLSARFTVHPTTRRTLAYR